ncbi:MAG: hypothetical protein IKK18_04240 [Clostridia bacterium]|nr:hypothetical protein [Clostridia bacterium]
MLKKKIIVLLGLVSCLFLITLNASATSLSEGTLDLDGQTMYVEGDFLHTGGTLNLGSGKLVISGNYYMTNETMTGFSDGAIIMDDSEGHLLVCGDFIMSGSSDNSEFLSAGTLEIKGDFEQCGQSIANFNPGGTHMVVLSGTGEQNVCFDSPDRNYFKNLKVTNTSGKVKFNNFSVNGEIMGNIISDFDIHLYNANLVLSGQTIKAPKLIWYNGGTIQMGNNVKIQGDLIHAGGKLEITGKCEITGNYYITGETDETFSNGTFVMTNSEGHLLVYGDFKMSGNSDNSDFLSAGTIEIKGDFEQQGQSASNFNPGGTHMVVLSGIGEQNVYFENPQGTHFNILVNKNVNGVVFKTAYRYNELKTIYPFDFEVVEYNKETNQINVDVFLRENLQSLNGNVIISLYDESNRLIECRIKELSELKPQIYNGLNDYDGAYIVKAFYWADMESIRPLCPSINRELSTQ